MLQKQYNRQCFKVMIYLLVVRLSSSVSVNLTALMEKYINVCGTGYTCDKWPSSLVSPVDYSEFRLCPKCFCDDSCFQNHNCCPDKFFRKPYSVYQSVIITIPEDTNFIFQKYAIVNTCPTHSDADEKSACQRLLTSVERFTNPPVTSVKSNVSYSNEHCAKCHNEERKHLRKWKIVIQDSCDVTLYYVSSYKEMLKMAQNKSCIVLYSPDYSVSKHVQEEKESDIRKPRSCNKTNMNNDIVKACQSSYDLTYRTHSNIFCAMCKTYIQKTGADPGILGGIIASCNKTGEWITYDKEIERSCQSHPQSEFTFPFKNAFCFLCNIRKYDSATLRPFTRALNDYTANVIETKSEKFYIKFKNIEIRRDLLWRQIVDNGHERTTENYTHGIIIQKDRVVNLTHIVMKMTSIASQNICDKTLLPYLVRNLTKSNCRCNHDCLFKEYCKCCLDTALAYPVTCINDSLNENETRSQYMVTDGCYRTDGRYDRSRYFSVLRSLCENDTNQRARLPVYANQISYKNVHCFLCNDGFKVTNDSVLHNHYKTWDLNIICSDELPFIYLATLDNVVAFARERECRIIFDTEKAVKCDTKKMTINRTCKIPPVPRIRNIDLPLPTFIMVNDTNFDTPLLPPIVTSGPPVLGDIDIDMQWMCESSFYGQFFSREFCGICYTYKARDNQCDKQSIGFNEYYQSACAIMPEVVGFYPYKNRFCRSCNDICGLRCVPEYNNRYNCRNSNGNIISGPNPTMNNLFIFGRIHSPPSMLQQDDKGGLSCYPGKFLSGGRCIHLLPDIFGVKYGMHFRCELKISTSGILIEDIFMQISTIVKSSVKNFFKRLNVHVNIKKYFFLPIISRNDLQKFRKSQVQAIIFMEIIPGYISNRSSFEYELFSFPSKFTTKGEVILTLPVQEVFRFTNSSLNSTSTQQFIESRVQFYIRGINFTSPVILFTWPYIFSSQYVDYLHYMEKLFYLTPVGINHVTRLLFCKQMKLKISDVIVNNESLEIKPNSSDRNFPIGQFLFGLDGSVHICYDDVYNVSRTTSGPEVDVILGLYTQICVIISLTCLLLAFLTYCAFPKLRSIPGKNIMNLVFAMFCAQVLFLFTTRIKDDMITCSILGVAQHYFWLVTCCCLSVCIFHTYRVFSGKGFTQAGLHFSDKTFCYYFFFSHLVPLTFVTLNICVHVGINGSIGYGTNVCFVEDKTSNIVTFVIPLSVTCVSNTFMFVKAARGIASSGKIRQSVKDEMKILVRLFSITGIVWVVQIVDGFVQWRPLSYISTTLTCLQGCFIFVSYCCKRKLWSKGGLRLSAFSIVSGNTIFSQWSRSKSLRGSREMSPRKVSNVEQNFFSAGFEREPPGIHGYGTQCDNKRTESKNKKCEIKEIKSFDEVNTYL